MIEARNILVRAPNWTGDVIMATPGLRALRRRFPEARIALHVRPGLEPLAHGAPWCDEVLPVVSYHRGLPALLREGRALRPRGFDLGICLPDSFSSALLFRAAGVRPCVGYRRRGRGPLLAVALDPPRDAAGGSWVPRERHVLGLMQAVGCDASDTRLELYVTPDEERGLVGLLERHGLPADAALAVLAPGASYGPSKRWPPRAFAEVGDALTQAGLRVVVAGAPSEAALAARVAGLMQAPAVPLAAELGLGGLKALVARSRVLVCNDAGARHVAVAFGVPSVVCFGPTALEKTGLNLGSVTVLSEAVPCRPCYRRACPIDHRCMTRIPARRAIEAALPALLRDGGRRAPRAPAPPAAGVLERTGGGA